MKYERVLTEIYCKPWAITAEKFAQIREIASLRASGTKLSKEEIQERLAPHMKARSGGGAQNYGIAAVIPAYGVISHRINLMSQMSGGTSTEKLTAQFRSALADPSVKVIVFDIDSPGGGVEGIPELAQEIYQSRGKKKSIAVTNTLAASAAYWLAASCSEIVITPSGKVGSIGVFVAHEDLSAALEKEGVKISLISAGKYKTEGNPWEPLSDSARSELQQKVNAFYDMFVKSVAKGRGVSQADVREGFGQGRLVIASEAVKEGMADRIATLDDTIARVSPDATPKRMAASAQPLGVQSLDDDGIDDCDCVCGNCVAGDCESCSNVECMDEACAADGCPMQESARATAKASAAANLERRRKEVDLHSRKSRD
jgi:signal peptide peptidase SppA